MTSLLATAYLLLIAEAPMTLDEAIQTAMQNGFSVKVASANIEKLRQNVNEAKGSMGPKLTATGTINELDKAGTMSLGASPVVITPKESKTAQFVLSFPIDIMGNIGRGVKAASLALKASKDTYNAQVNDLKLSVRQSYYQVLQAQELVGVNEDALKGATERLENAKKSLEVGAIAKVDVLRYEALVAQSNSDLIASRNTLALVKNAFNNTLSRPIDTEVVLAPIADRPVYAGDTATLTNVATKMRPEVRAMINQVEALRYVREAEERGQQPSLSVAATHTQALDVGLGGRKESSSATIQISFPIFDSGITRARVKAARQDEVIAKTQFEQLKLGVSLEVYQAITNLTNARARLEVAKRQVVFAAENYRLAKVKQTAGEGIALEVIDAQTVDTQAKAGLISAGYDYLSAYAQLQRAIGNDDVAHATVEPKETKK
jgi:outer membrane protein TolC